MKNLFKYMSFINIILYLVLPTNIFAEYTPFSNAKNARELIKIAEKLNLRVNLRSVPAKTLEQYDSVSQIHVSGRYVYAYWHNSFRLPSYLGKSINEVKREFANSNIILKILYTPTYSDNYNRVAKQSIYPRQIIYASKLVKTTNSTKEKDQTPKYTGFTKPKLIQGGSNTQNTSNKQFNQKTNRYDEEGNTILSLYVYKYAGKPKKMIDLSNLTLEEAKRKIKEANFPIGYIQDSYEKTSNPKLFGKIFEQTIKAGTLVDKPQYMGVKIYGFPATKMPDLTKGWTVTKASKTSYLSLITLYTKTYDKTLDGIIFEQSVKPGTLLIKKTLLTIKAYKYENPYYRADFIHLNQDKAIEIAKQRNLEYEIVTKDIFEYFKSTTLGNDFYQKQHDTIVDVTQNGKKLVLTVVKFVQKEGIMPNFIEQACSDIVKPMYKLKQKIPGLTYKTEYIAETVFEKSDKVASTKPIAGEKIKSLDNII